MPGAKLSFTFSPAMHTPIGKPPPKPLRRRYNVRQNARALIAEEVARAADARLHFVKHHQHVTLRAQCTHGL